MQESTPSFGGQGPSDAGPVSASLAREETSGRGDAGTRGHGAGAVWIVVAVAALALCCCCSALVAVIGGTSFLLPVRSVGSSSPGPVVVVTRLPSPTPRPTRLAPTANAAPGISPAPTPTVAQDMTAQDNTELLAADMPARDIRELSLRLKPDGTDIPVVVNATPPSYKLGDTARFTVSDNDTQEHREITAMLRYITDHVYMWVEAGIQVDQADLERSAQRFETETYPTNREFFGSEWTPGVDNDVHLTILNASGLGKTVGGYYSSADEYSHLANPYSNEREMFYISADGGSLLANTSYYDGTLAHEFQHMIHWAADRNEDSWVNEGMAELAGFLNGFSTGNADIAFSENPDTQLTTWPDPSLGNVEHYGASYLFMNYFLDRFGEELTKAVVISPENGIEGFDAALAAAGRPERFNDIFADWVIANYLDRPGADPEGRFGYSKIDPYPPAMAETYRRYPESGMAQVSQYGSDYIRLTGRGPVTIAFEGRPQVSLMDTRPIGTRSWWSNRGDDSDATLTRSFDLRKVASATLNFSTWYDIEDGWDYVYVEASSDGGQTWQILPGRYTTDKNPVGNAFGIGWTGISGGGSKPQWVEERVDLTPFAGKEILLRFEYVTDDAVNEAGFLLDSITIPEIGYEDDAEEGVAGWDAAGWALTPPNNTLKQSWLVQLIEVGRDKAQVQRMEVGADGKGALTIDDLGKLEEAVLVISGLSPVTTEKATYRYTISAP